MNMETRIIFFHGFNSGVDSTKWEFIQKIPSIDPVLCVVDYTTAGIRNFIDYMDEYASADCILIGHSLGAFWARYMSVLYDLPCILLNPSFTPSQTLNERLGVAQSFYLGAEERVVTCRTGHKKLPAEIVYVERGDDVINHATVERATKNSDVRYIEGGSHRFESLNMIEPAINEIKNRPWQ